MSELDKATEKAVQEKIAYFNELLNDGWGKEAAKKHILDNTCLVAVRQFVEKA